jgi:LPXTG-site transpeptidase (sortase) family protein
MCYHYDPMKVETWSDLIDALLLRKVSFLVTFFVVFLLSYALFAWLDLLPEPIEPASVDTEVAETDLAIGTVIETAPSNVTETKVSNQPVFPDTIIIDALDREVAVLNPTSRTIADLDAALLYGVVRHPDSATLEQSGTVFVLGHSSYLPTVLNNNFQAFNGIQNLSFGDTIRLQAGDDEYVYRVDRVYRAKAQDVTVPIAGDTKRLVLATCNSFGSIDDRYVVEASLVTTVAIAKE